MLKATAMSARALQATVPAGQATEGDENRHASGIVTSGLRRFAQEELETLFAERPSGRRVMVSIVVPKGQPFAIAVRLLERINDFIHSLSKASRTIADNACGRVVVYVAEVPHEETIAEQLLTRTQIAVPFEQRALVAGFAHLRLLRHGVTTRAADALLDERLLSY